MNSLALRAPKDTRVAHVGTFSRPGPAFGEGMLDDASPQVQVIAQLVTATSLTFQWSS
jgi:hypothetical protein